ncbi:diacylglycerol/lipid kinase family protein [Olivibacter sitiensis]|uniref:diacylglycerol/lipid kinase family protein n=1 Tax=Olivibacter sitiensis TaxID=376470 RepID=UPI000416E044|nr:diacylglycerol kinase family protein [Olivibacter sitiensis]
MPKRRIQFIINPIAGGKDKTDFQLLVEQYLDPRDFESYFSFTEYVSHGIELAKAAVENKVDMVVAVGGDGTINEVASGVLNSDIPLGIVPLGSGNGLARFLKIPIDPIKAIQRIASGKVGSIDSGQVNGRAFFNMAGVGFDALISNRFAEKKNRGALEYMKVVLSEINKYKPKQYTIETDGAVISREAFMISIANSPQYGNNAYVSPKASLRDGLLDVCIIKQFPLYQFPILIFHLFSRTADQSEYVEIIKAKRILIRRTNNEPVHLDGEPYEYGEELLIEVLPHSLKVVC